MKNPMVDVDLRNMFIAGVIVGILLGAVITAVLPLTWVIIKPFVHALKAK